MRRQFVRIATARMFRNRHRRNVIERLPIFILMRPYRSKECGSGFWRFIRDLRDITSRVSTVPPNGRPTSTRSKLPWSESGENHHPLVFFIWLLGLTNFQNRQWQSWQRNGRISQKLSNLSNSFFRWDK